MAARQEIIDFCDELLRIADADDYGPNGLQVPGKAAVRTVVSGVSANREFLERAIRQGADLALVHHGLFWDSTPRALSETMAERLRLALGAHLSLAAYHLPLDAHREIGNNALLCERLGFSARDDPFAQVRGISIGVIGDHPEGIAAQDLFGRVGELTGRAPLLFASGPEVVRSIGIVSGAGSSQLGEAVALGLDAFLTGEPAEPAMAEAREGGVHFIAAGHYATETLGIQRLGELVCERFSVEHRFIDVPNPI